MCMLGGVNNLASVFLGAPEISSFGFRVFLLLVPQVGQSITNRADQSSPKLLCRHCCRQLQ